MSYKRYRDGKLLKPSPDKNGYLCLNLCKNNKIKMYRVHRLVALNFLPNYHDLPQVDHKERHRIIAKESQQRIIDSKKYYCEMCNISCHCESVLENHYKTKKHLDNITKESNESTN